MERDFLLPPWQDKGQLTEGRFRLDIRKTFFMIRMVGHWNRLPREVVDAPCLEMFKVRLDRSLSNLIYELAAPSLQLRDVSGTTQTCAYSDLYSLMLGASCLRRRMVASAPCCATKYSTENKLPPCTSLHYIMKNYGNGSEQEWEVVLQILEQRFHFSWWRDHGEAYISLQPLERTMPGQISTLQPVEDLTPEQLGTSLNCHDLSKSTHTASVRRDLQDTPSSFVPQNPQGEEKVSGSDNKGIGTAATPAPPTTSTAATPVQATDSAVEPGNQPVLVSVTPIHKKKSWKRKSACLEREDEKAGPSQGEKEEELVDEMETTRSLSLSEL
ncbi:LOW QUALITY PROTEIN: hypothetical protein QYF61_011742 [Mycteria americana]|uniref:Uncharacterized protein n=1 Tax=Mycteria americana TaxID=33587 RepID=A0AAN7NS89_MYCAM|nr:LOW QUALITY PROTEIN: hypothetical protein QYF61_011742 [Mycteria americana]